MRGRTNITVNMNKSTNEDIKINGNVETYKVAEGNAINKGDFVSIYKDVSPITNIIQMPSCSENDSALLSFMGEYKGNKFYYMISSSSYKSVILLVCYSPNGEILFSTNMPASGFNEYGINEMAVVGNIVFATIKYNDSDKKYYNSILLYNIDIDGKKIEQIHEETLTKGDTSYPSFVCMIDEEKFAITMYDYTSTISKKILCLYQIIYDNETVSFNMLDTIEIEYSPTPILKVINNKIVCINGTTSNYTNCTIIEITENNKLNIILDNKIGSQFSSSIKLISSILFVDEDLLICRNSGSSSAIYVIDILNGIVKSTYREEYLNSITYYDGTLYGIVSEGRYRDVYVMIMRYYNGLFTTDKEMLLFNDDGKPEIEFNGLNYYMGRNTYLDFYDNNAKFISYYYRIYNRDSYLRFFTEINMIKKGQDFMFNDDYIKQYDGTCTLGVAKTSGNTGDIIEIYVPKET